MTTAGPKPSPRDAFAATRWTVVLSAREQRSPQSSEALETLCRNYWYPLYAYVRRQGRNPHDAEDLTQAFFARLLERNYLAEVDQAKGKFSIKPDQHSVGILDLKTCRLAMVNPDRGDYAASVAKVGILLAYFQIHPEAATNIDPIVKHELGRMAKASDNEMASKFSHELGLKKIQSILNSYDLYNTNHGGGIWVGKHYGKGTERFGDPLGDNSHAATVRQLLRYFLWLEQGKLVSPAASKTMREIFASPDIPHDDIKFVKGLAGRNLKIIRKWGTWQDWLHDSAVITGPNRHYILVAMTRNPKGDDYLVELSKQIDDVMAEKQSE